MEALSRQECNLIATDIILNECLQELNLLTTISSFEGSSYANLADDLCCTITSRIKQRRSVLYTVAEILHDPHYDFQYERNFGCIIPNEEQIITVIEELSKVPIISTTDHDQLPDYNQASGSSQSEEHEMTNNSFSERLSKKLTKIKERELVDDSSNSKGVAKVSNRTLIRNEYEAFKNDAGRGCGFLFRAYSNILAIPSSSIDPERTFSTSGKFVTKLRCSMADDTLNTLVFLNHYFQNFQ
jgi:hypothetical protein